MTMETAPVENPEYAEEQVAKKLTSVQTAKPNAQMYFAWHAVHVQYAAFACENKCSATFLHPC